MKIVIAPDSFKGSLSAADAAEAMAAGVKQVFPNAETVLIPLADGGEGTVDAWIRACGGRLEVRRVTGPLGETMSASFGALADDDRTAVVETAAASGLTLVPMDRRNPLHTTTYGTGELIRHAIESGTRRVIIGLGGSATNDGGAGALQALGVRFVDPQGAPIPIPATGTTLASIVAFDGSAAMAIPGDVEIVLASDVMNPLIGEAGASAVYGPQKGATPEMVAALDMALTHYASILARDLGVDVANVPGAGAAGGLGAALMAFFGAHSRSGIDLILDAAGFDDAAVDADFVITGEGSIDGQTLSGKAVAGVVSRIKKLGGAVVIAVGGIVDDAAREDLNRAGVDFIEAASPADMPRDEAMARAAELVEAATSRVLEIAARKLHPRNRP
jgi:glycerate kinase